MLRPFPLGEVTSVPLGAQSPHSCSLAGCVLGVRGELGVGGLCRQEVGLRRRCAVGRGEGGCAWSLLGYRRVSPVLWPAPHPSPSLRSLPVDVPPADVGAVWPQVEPGPDLSGLEATSGKEQRLPRDGTESRLDRGGHGEGSGTQPWVQGSGGQGKVTPCARRGHLWRSEEVLAVWAWSGPGGVQSL